MSASRLRQVITAIGLLIIAVALQLATNAFMPSAGLRRAIAASAVVLALTLLARGRVRDAAVMLTSLCVGFAALEGIALYMEKPRAAWIDSGMRQPRPYVGFGPTHPGKYLTKNVAPDGQVYFDVINTIGDNLLRVTDAPAGDGAIAFFGDSFTFGAGVADQDTITQAFANLTGKTVPVPNVSFSGWSPAQNLATLQHGLNDDVLHRPRRFVLMTAPWHMERTACKVAFVHSAPRYRLEAGELVVAGSCFAQGTPYRYLHGFALYRTIVEPRLFKLTKQDAETYYAIVDRFVSLTKQKYGADTTIIALPNFVGNALDEIGSNEAEYLARLKKSGADVFVDPLPWKPKDNPYVIPGDLHPTGLANRVLAKLLLEHFRETLPDLLPEHASLSP